MNSFYFNILRTLKNRGIKVKAKRLYSFPGDVHEITLILNRKKHSNYFDFIIFDDPQFEKRVEIFKHEGGITFVTDTMHDTLNFYTTIMELVNGKEKDMIKWLNSLDNYKK